MLLNGVNRGSRSQKRPDRMLLLFLFIYILIWSYINCFLFKKLDLVMVTQLHSIISWQIQAKMKQCLSSLLSSGIDWMNPLSQ